MSQRDRRIAETIDVLENDEARDAKWRFFITFSRFEYALKRAGFLRSRRRRRNDKGPPGAEPDWDKFERRKENEAAFAADCSKALQAARTYFEKQPPKRQVVKDGMLGWEKGGTPDASKDHLKWLLCEVRCVRNNLFHGGKFPASLGSPDDPRRNKYLIGHAQCILEAVLEYDPKVREYFCDVVRQ
jgi:hypothetical protein